MTDLPDHKTALARHRLQRAVRDQAGIRKPEFGWECAGERRLYTGSVFPDWTRCSKAPRPGHWTCHWHREREEDCRMAWGEREKPQPQRVGIEDED